MGSNPISGSNGAHRRARVGRGGVVRIRVMTRFRRSLWVLGGSLAVVGLVSGTAVAQSIIIPTVTPVENKGGWVFNMAQLFTVIGVLIVLMLVVAYMRF